MRVLLFGATGMIGQGVLRECLADRDVERVAVFVRSSTGVTDPKLREIVQSDPTDVSTIASELGDYDTVLWCLGISSVGMSEEDYTSVTYDYTMRVANALAPHKEKYAFLFVSGRSTDATEKGSVMWARVKGRAENGIRAVGFRRAVMFRPAYIQPLHGIRSKTRLYAAMYAVISPLYGLMKPIFPDAMTTTQELGRVMLHVAKVGSDLPVLESADIARLGASLR